MKTTGFKNRKTRVFIDTSVIIAGLFSSTGASAAILDLCESEMLEMVVNKQVLTEADRNFEKRFSCLVQEFRNFLKNTNPTLVADPTNEEVKKAQKLINSKDSPILAAALREKVDFLITLDNHFLLIKEKVAIKIVSPAEFIKKFRLDFAEEV